MAKVTTVEIIDDIDGSKADETVSFALDGVSYEIDLNGGNAAALRDALALYISHGTRVGGRKARAARGGGAAMDKDRITEIREWARKNGHTVSDRGRLSAAVVAAYDAAH